MICSARTHWTYILLFLSLYVCLFAFFNSDEKGGGDNDGDRVADSGGGGAVDYTGLLHALKQEDGGKGGLERNDWGPTGGPNTG